MTTYNREVRAMRAEPIHTRNLYGERILCDDAITSRYTRYQDHLYHRHGLMAVPAVLSADAVNEEVAAVSTRRSWEYLCQHADEPAAAACWPAALATVGEVTVFRRDAWERALAAAREMADAMPDEDDDPDVFDGID